jgi:hypothetical protein
VIQSGHAAVVHAEASSVNELTASLNPMLVIYGSLGGLLPDALRLIRERKRRQVPAYLRSGSFWLSLVLLGLLGGLAAAVLNADSPTQALAFGFAAPELFSRAIAATAERGELRQWWAR